LLDFKKRFEVRPKTRSKIKLKDGPLNIQNIRKHVSQTRGAYQNYSHIPRYQKAKLIEQLRNRKRGDLTRISSETRIKRQTLQNWIKNWKIDDIPKGKYRKKGGGRNPMLTYEYEGRNLNFLYLVF